MPIDIGCHRNGKNGKICLRDSETLSVNMRKKFYNLYGPSKLAKSTFTTVYVVKTKYKV